MQATDLREDATTLPILGRMKDLASICRMKDEGAFGDGHRSSDLIRAHGNGQARGYGSQVLSRTPLINS